VEDRELVALVLREPDLGIVERELEAVWRRRLVAARLVALRDPATHQDETARLVRCGIFSVRDERGAHLGGHYHQTVRPIDSSTSPASQKSAERYFQPPSASTQRSEERRVGKECRCRGVECH